MMAVLEPDQQSKAVVTAAGALAISRRRTSVFDRRWP
jgi:hypothetical protein